MEFGSKLRWILLVGIVVIMLFLVGWGMFSIASSLFNGNSSQSVQVIEEDFDVLSTKSARLYVDGPVVASSDHRSYEIVVSRGVVTVTFFSDFGQKVIEKKSFSNNSLAYDAFLNSLANEDVTSRQRNTTEDDDYKEAGACSTGRTYIVELDSEVRRWSTDCSTKQGTAGHNTVNVINLFRAQVSGIDQMTSELGFSF